MEAKHPSEDNRSPDSKQPLQPEARPEAISPTGRPKETPTVDGPKEHLSNDRSSEARSEDTKARDRAKETRERSGQDRSFGSLFSNLAHDVTTLVRQEIHLAKAEGSEKMSQAVSGIVSIVIAAALALAGLIILLQAAVYGLNIGLSLWLPMEPTLWLSALIVGGVVVLIGLMLVLKGRSNLQANNLMPDKTIESVKRDRDFVRKQPS